jgi:ligand-binding sensor domain-containing protein
VHETRVPERGGWRRLAIASLLVGAGIAWLAPGHVQLGGEEGAPSSLESRLVRVAGGESVVAIQADARGDVWLVTRHAVTRFASGDPERPEVLLDSEIHRERFGHHLEPITAARVSVDRELWVGTRTGRLLRFVDGAWIEESGAHDGPTDPIDAIAFLERDVWLGGRGLWRWSGAERSLSLAGFAGHRVGALEVSPELGLVAGVDDRVMARARGAWRRVFQGEPTDGAVTALLARPGELLVASRDGLARVATGDGAVRRELEGRWVCALARSPGGALWVGTRDHGVYVERGGALEPLRAGGPGETHRVETLAADGPRVWLALRGAGVWLAEPGRTALVAAAR